MDQLAQYVDGLPNICGSESLIDVTLRSHGQAAVFWRDGTGDPFVGAGSACAIALHKPQPLIPADGEDLRSTRLIGNLQYMEEHRDVGDKHNAPVFRWRGPGLSLGGGVARLPRGHCVAPSMPVQGFACTSGRGSTSSSGCSGWRRSVARRTRLSSWTARALSEARPSPAGLYEFGRRDGEHCRDHQDAGRRHEAGRTDGALLRGVHAWAVGARGSGWCRRWWRKLPTGRMAG